MTTYTQFSTSFVASSTSEFVSFAFREAPAFFSLDDVSVTQQGSGTNLLADPGFESDTPSNVGTNFPVGWNRWIQAVDTSAIGEVTSTTSSGGCSAPHSGTYFWCDGSVQGYDALYQQLNGLTVGATYNITFWLTDNSNAAITNPTIDLLIYAGTVLPNGAVTIGSTPPSGTPAPSTILLVGLGMLAVALFQWRKTRAASMLIVVLMAGVTVVRAQSPNGTWTDTSTDSTAPKSLTINVSGTSVSGTMDSYSITNGGASNG